MRHQSIIPTSKGISLARALGGFLAITAVTLLLTQVGVSQGSDHDAVANDLNNLAKKAQDYYKSQGNSSFAGFTLGASDTGNANGSYSIYDGGEPPMGASYVPGSTAGASAASAQTLYIVGCGKGQGKDGVNPVKVYAAVTPTGVTIVDLN